MYNLITSYLKKSVHLSVRKGSAVSLSDSDVPGCSDTVSTVCEIIIYNIVRGFVAFGTGNFSEKTDL